MSELPPNAVTFDWNCLTGVIICGAHVAPFVKRGVSKRKGSNTIVSFLPWGWGVSGDPFCAIIRRLLH